MVCFLLVKYVICVMCKILRCENKDTSTMNVLVRYALYIFRFVYFFTLSVNCCF